MTTVAQPIHVNTGLLHAHANRLTGFANQLDGQRASLTAAVGMLTWNSSTPNHAAIVGAYDRALGLLKTRADAIRREAVLVNKYAEVMAMVDDAYKVAPLGPAMPWRGTPAAITSGGTGEGFGASNTFWTTWNTFNSLRGPMGVGTRVVLIPGILTIRIPTTVVTMQPGRFGGENVVLFNRDTVLVDRSVDVTVPLRSSAPWLPALEKASKFMAVISIGFDVYGLFRPEHQDPGARVMERAGHVSGIGSALMILTGLGATVAGTVLSGFAIGVPIGLWREDTYERWDAEGRGPVNSVGDAVQLVVNPLKQADTGLYVWHEGWKWAGTKYYDNVDFKVGGMQFGVKKAVQPVDRYQLSAAIGATLRELQARYPGLRVDRSVPREIAVIFPSGERVVISQ